jgi:hypothetical protein
MPASQAAGDGGRRRVAVLVALQGVTAVGLVGFWIAFFTLGIGPTNPPPGYAAFEHAFPGPDLLLATVLLAAAASNRHPSPRRRALGRTLSLAAAGALVFLGCLDVSFNLQNGMYTLAFADGLAAAAINAWCIGIGALMIRLCVAHGE